MAAPRPRRRRALQPPPTSHVEVLRTARQVLEQEARAITGLTLDARFVEALEIIDACRGAVVCTGMGKAGFIAQKLSATLASIGVTSYFLHPAEAAHGDLGRVKRKDVVLALSNSGQTREVVDLVPALKRLGARVVALTAEPDSPLGRLAQHVVPIGRVDEACPLKLVPTASTAALHALGDALAMSLSVRRGFTESEYAQLHPAGALGVMALTVRDVMRTGASLPLVRSSATLKEAVVVMTRTPGRPGAALVVDRHGALEGIFTDGDLRRLAETDTLKLARPIREVMVTHPTATDPGALVVSAVEQMRQRSIDQLPVIDRRGRAVGLLDVQDVLGPLAQSPSKR